MCPAKKELSDSVDAFLDALRPYQRILPRTEFYRVVEAMRGVVACIREDPIDRGVLDVLLTLLRLVDLWALHPDGMLPRNKLITEQEQQMMRRWHGVLSKVLGQLVARADVEVAFEPYAELRQLEDRGE